MAFTHVFIARPRQESEELASMLKPLGFTPVVQPAFNFMPLDAAVAQPDVLQEMERAGAGSLLVFTSPRSVSHGLRQLPSDLLYRARVAAIGPSTSRALVDAGIRVSLTPASGYTSEALIAALAAEQTRDVAKGGRAFLVTAPGGRTKLLDSLGRMGWTARQLFVYKSEPAELDREILGRLKDADGVLSVWTSANALKGLSQRLPPATWFQLCQGEWLVISERLKRLSRAYGPADIHLCKGPSNADLLHAIRGLS